MKAVKIILKYLEDNGYDGLYHDTGLCSCEKTDLAPCGNITEGCMAGYYQPITNIGGLDYDFVIGRDKTNKESEK